MSRFLQAKRSGVCRPELVWSDDGCSLSPEHPLGFKFHNSCRRHDFGYRNYRYQGRLTERNREMIDDNFLRDMSMEYDKVPGRSYQAFHLHGAGADVSFFSCGIWVVSTTKATCRRYRVSRDLRRQKTAIAYMPSRAGNSTADAGDRAAQIP